LLEGIAATELAHHDFVGRPSHVFGTHDLVGISRFHHAVLVNARGMRKRIGANNRLVGLHHKTSGLADHATGSQNLGRIYTKLHVKVVFAGAHRHHDLF
jgi:hypothetical protein